MPDFITPGLNPLEIPEIIAIVGQQIPLCQKRAYSDPFNLTTISTTAVFMPKDLLACTAVSRTWRRILLPILWGSYDGALMRYVSPEVLQANSVFFRSFRDQFRHYHPGPFFATNLRQLIISQQHKWAVPFMFANPGLHHLTWTGFGHPLLDNEFSALTSLANLRDLCLSNWNISGRQLALILNASPRLLRLSLSFVDGVQDLDGMLILFALEEISLGFIPEKSQGLFELVRYCPGLKRISFLSTWIPEQARDLVALSSRIRCCCPDVCSIQFSAAYCFGSNSFNTLKDFEYAALVQSTDHLERFAAELYCLDHMLTTSLLGQFEFLAAVDLCIRRDGKASADSLQFMDICNSARILSTCSHLRVFRLSSAENMIDMNAALELFASPWVCLGLEVLSLGQISFPPLAKHQQDSRKSTKSSFTFRDYGWYVQPKTNTSFASAVSPKATTAGVVASAHGVGPSVPVTPFQSTMGDELWHFGSEFRQKLLPQVSLLTLLRELCLNKVHYARASIV
ncbi:hypothetical protein BCR41DRAFT_392578 [Lobosporangium transversale]|uniref:F-box domain-containing protein n=1 Tax=Lobosporangium transversale TaxID=64571 RepID=A0A1Y2GY62_9FUNG|nr:hypothetical protein BCR41DRAFT_392578 [Lobosporangium transversale]ORZ27248.1 hypothetical protein BCR41DRAFT_392578 [Lobosporangium transversale]|eukprot:XP_021884975.1 hypothetical protein BCR41DRAFT_392578 [Lobosporangium transversale]